VGKCCDESFAENQTEFATGPLSASAAYSGANKFVLLFHLSEKKKRHNQNNGDLDIGILEAALHQPHPFGSFE
jgi:hypothetical protein